MAVGGAGESMRYLDMLYRTVAFGGLTDKLLLDRFLAERGESAGAAFAALVERHGPMVLGVCRRALPDPHDADDAFQATFLVLVRKAGSIRVEDTLGPWLYGVARRIAARARAEAGRRSRREVGLAIADGLPARGESAGDRLDDRAVLDEELGRLPAKYRDPLVLCYLQGRTHEGAARQLGWPVGTVRGRLARARDLLRGRLARRGLGQTEVPVRSCPVIPLMLMDSTVRIASGIAAGRAAAAVATARAVAWAEWGLRSMRIVRWKGIAGVALAVGAIGAGASLIANRAWAEVDPRPPVAQVPAEDRQEILGTWGATGTITSFIGGVAQPPRQEKTNWVFTADKLAMIDSDGFFTQQARYVIDPTKEPKAIDLTFLETGVTWLGIYQLDGDEFTISFDIKRPKDFREGPGGIVLKFKRESRDFLPLVSRHELAPGCLWIIKPFEVGCTSMMSNGVHLILDQDRDGALVVIIAHARKGDPDSSPECRPVVFDSVGVRYLLEAVNGGSASTAVSPGMSISMIKYRLDPSRLPADKVKELGVEVVPEDVLLARKEEESTRAFAAAKAEGIDLLPRPRVGEPYAFTLKGADGRVINSRDLGGKVVLVDCWATWCGPCVAKMPELKELYDKRHGDGLEVVGVNFDQKPEAAGKAIEALGLPWAQVLVPTDERIRDLWESAAGLDSLPRLLLIDREGVLRYDGGPDEIEEQVARWLDVPAPGH